MAADVLSWEISIPEVLDEELVVFPHREEVLKDACA
jgi:hypothetical protein